MYKNITFLRKEHFSDFHSGMKKTAKLSEIAKKLTKKPVTTSDLDELFEKFKNDMLESHAVCEFC